MILFHRLFKKNSLKQTKRCGERIFENAARTFHGRARAAEARANSSRGIVSAWRS